MGMLQREERGVSQDPEGWHHGVRARLPQSCSDLRNPVGCRPPGSSVHGVLQARILGWVAMPSSGGSS